jgi:hypothetical protein
MPTRFSATSPVPSVNQQATSAIRKSSTPSKPPTDVRSARYCARLKHGADGRTRPLRQAPGLMKQSVSCNPTGHNINSGQTSGQGLMPRKNPCF